MATDANGNAYVAGVYSTSATSQLIVVFKLDRSNQIVYRYVFGGSGLNYPSAVDVDSAGSLFVAGITNSPDFPLVNPLIRKAPQNGEQGFISKIDPTGTQLLFSTFLGGTTSNLINTQVTALALDTTGNVYVTGTTLAIDFPVTVHAYSTAGTSFVTKVSNAGDQILYSTFLGPGSRGLAIAASSDGTATIAGSVYDATFPVTPSAFQTVCNCNPNLHTTSFVTRLSADGSLLVWSTYLGGRDGGIGGPTEDTAKALALTSDGGVVVAGIAQSPNFPVTPGAFQTKLRTGSGSGAAPTLFLSRLNASGSALKFSTYLGGSNAEVFYGLQLDTSENPWVTGVTYSPDFPSLPHNLNLGPAFNVKLASDGSKLLETQMLPAGTAFPVAGQSGQSLALDAAGNEIMLAFGSLLRIPAGGPFGTAILAAANAAAYSASATIAPGEIFSLFGTGLGPPTGVGAKPVSGRIATTLAGVQVTFDGIPAPLVYVGANQINAIAPFEISGRSSTSVQVLTLSEASAPVDLIVTPANPEIFTVPPPAIDPQFAQFAHAAALNQDGSLNSQDNPAKVGSVVSLWCTGAGLFTRSLLDGAIVQPPLSKTVLPVSVWFDTQPAEVLYAGPAPDLLAGAFQVNTRVPPNIIGSDDGVWVQVGDFVSDNVLIYLKR